MALWLIRAGRHGEREQLALDQGVVAIGWDELSDLSSIESREELLALIKETYPGDKQGTQYSWTGQLWRFLTEIKVGDRVAMPLKSKAAVAFGTIKGDYRYVASNPPSSRHTRKVEWTHEILRSKIPQDLLYSLGALLTVCKLSRNDAENRFEALLTGKAVQSAQPVLNDSDDGAGEAIDFEQYARDQITEYIQQNFKGHGLARLTGAVLGAEGYDVTVSPEGPDGGVDILAGTGPMGFGTPRLCVQVKSGQDPVDVKVLRELQGVMSNFGAQQGLLVSWGGFKRTVVSEARQRHFEIRLWDSDELVRRIQANYRKLPDEIQAELPLKPIWVLVPEEE